MLNNSQEFVTSSDLINMSWDQVSQWYKRLVDTDIRTYLENPTDYQSGKNNKHLGTVCMFDPGFTSKFLSQSTLYSQVGSAAISGTLGLDDRGRPSLWLQNEESIGLLWAKPSDTGTSCSYTKIVLLEEKPGFDQGKTHTFPVENVQGYTALYFSGELLDYTHSNNKSQWTMPEPETHGIQPAEQEYTEDMNVRKE